MRPIPLLALAAACAPIADATDPTAEPVACAPDLEVGTGQFAFEPLSESDGLSVARGAQGSDRPYHVEVSGVVTGMSREVAVAPVLTLLDSGEVLAGDQNPAYLALADYDEAACTGVFWGVQARVDDLDPPDPTLPYADFVCSLEGAPVELDLAITNLATGEVVSSTVALVLALDETAQCR